jgi:hypothetical protein
LIKVDVISNRTIKATSFCEAALPIPRVAATP